MERTYLCPRYPSLRIGDKIKFTDGMFVTSNLAHQGLIESNDLWGAGISAVDTDVRSEVRKVMRAMNVDAGVALEKTEEDVFKEETVQPDEPAQPDNPYHDIAAELSLTATDINGMLKSELQDICGLVGIDPEQRASKLKRELKVKLGV